MIVILLLASIAVAAVIAAASGLATSWDGPAYLWTSLDRQVPFSPNRRYINVLLQQPVLLASRLSSDSWTLETVFGLAYAGVPLAVLAGSVWAVGWRSRLLVWPAMSVGFAAVLSTANATSEATMASLLFWPALLAMLSGRAPSRSLVAIALAAISIIAHPFAIATLAACAVVACMGRSWSWAAVFGVGALAGVGRLLWFSVPYETSRVLGDGVPDLARYAIGPHLVGFILGLAAAVVLLIGARRRWRRAALPVAALAGGGLAALALWSASPDSLVQTFYLRSALPVFIAPFALLAVIDAWWGSEPAEPADAGADRSWALAISISAATFVLVTSLQAAHWSSYRAAVQTSLASSPTTCIPLEPLPHMPGLGGPFWTETQYSITLQGRVVTRIAEPGDICSTGQLEQEVPISFMETRQYGVGWFSLDGLRESDAP